MAQFYAEIQGNRGMATRMGTKESGMFAHIRGWDVGVKVFLDWDEEEQRDIVTVYQTGGSNQPGTKAILLRICEGGEPESWVP